MAKSRPPDEKSIEVVFAAYVARLAHEMGKKLITFAPSQAKEKALGYDSRLIGEGCRELYIQFKRASAHNYGLAFHPSDKAQLNTLKTKYPPLSAFYVAASFADDHALLHAQHRLAAPKLLDQYFAVDAQALECDSNSVRFNACILTWKCHSLDFPNHGPAQMRYPIERRFWLTGSELLCRFLGCDHRFLSRGPGRYSVPPTRGCRLVVRNGQVFREAVDIAHESPNYGSWPFDTGNEPVYMPGDEVTLMLRVCD